MGVSARHVADATTLVLLPVVAREESRNLSRNCVEIKLVKYLSKIVGAPPRCTNSFPIYGKIANRCLNIVCELL